MHRCAERSPLYTTAQSGHQDAACRLLEDSADVRLAMEDGCTPLCVASHEFHQGVCCLLKHHADVDHAEVGRTAARRCTAPRTAGTSTWCVRWGAPSARSRSSP